jgi:hypothetical protein
MFGKVAFTRRLNRLCSRQKLSARMPYRQVVATLREFLPVSRKEN